MSFFVQVNIVCLEIPITVHRATCDAVKFVCLFCCLVEAHCRVLSAVVLCAPAILNFRSVVRYPLIIFLAQDNRRGLLLEEFMTGSVRPLTFRMGDYFDFLTSCCDLRRQ